MLRVTGFLTVAEVSAEHRILRRLRQGYLPFRVPEPVAAADGRTVVETPAGPATLCRWLPGVRPGVGSEMAFERLGRAVGLVDAALADVPLADTLRDWRTDPRWVRPEDPPADLLVDELRAAGMGAEQAGLVTAAARRAGRWWPGTDRLPAQVIHGDLTPANLLADPRTGEVIGLLDFELAGAGLPGAGHHGGAVSLHRADHAGLAAPDGRVPARRRLGQPACARRGGGPARAAHRPVARLRPVAGGPLAGRARALRRRHRPRRKAGGEHAGGSPPTRAPSCSSRRPPTPAS